MKQNVLVINAGSSSIKFQVYASAPDGPKQRLKGQLEGIGARPHLIATDAGGKIVKDQSYAVADITDTPTAVEVLRLWLREHLAGDFPFAVGHRVVHGGPDFDQAVLIDESVLTQLERYVPLAPLHQPHNLLPMRIIRRNQPQMLQVACFDTAFHRAHGELADRFAIPEALYDEGIRRYGFHGLSYEYISQALLDIAPEAAKGRVVVGHLGSGASLCALQNGKSVDSTMGFTALDGLAMGTRSGQLDPGVVLYLLTEKGMSAQEVERLLYNDCGLKGLSGISNDVRDLLASTEPRARLALDFFAYRIAKEIAGLTSVLGGLDTIVFTAGIGENASEVRKNVCDRLAWLGITLDEKANEENAQLISRSSIMPAVYVIPTDEEWMIAQHTVDIVGQNTPIEAASDIST